MIDFATLQGLTIPEGVVTQITDESGRVIWAVSGGKVILEVEKITSDTYVSSTSYTGEAFILLDIYPKKSNSTVTVTYGGLTKTLSFTSTSKKQVYFGTYGGVADSVATPASGTLTIEGDCVGVGVSSFNTAKNSTTRCSCITAITDFGGMKKIPSYAFYKCYAIALAELPSGITSIGDHAFYNCTGITLSELPSGITSIEAYTFDGCTGITLSKLPSGITSIGEYAFYNCTGITTIVIPASVMRIDRSAFYGTSLTRVEFENTSGWYITGIEGTQTPDSGAIEFDVSDPVANASELTSPRGMYYQRFPKGE